MRRGQPGVPAVVSVLLDSSQGEAIEAWSYGICHDGAFLELAQVASGATASALNDGDGPFVDVIAIEPGAGWTVGAVGQIVGSAILLPDPDIELNTATYDVLGSGTSTVSFCETLGTPTVDVVLVVGVETVSPVTTDGTVTAAPTFIRGDADGNAVFNGLVDGLYILSFRFQGGPSPPCMEAADANGSGQFGGLVDGLYVLSHQFQGGPPPPPPYPSCGVDPEPMMSLGCANSTCP